MSERQADQPAGARRASGRPGARRLAGRWVATLIILAVVYCDCSAIFRLSGIRADLLIHWFVYRMFAIFSVFETAPASNRIFEAEALVRDGDAMDINPEWKTIDIYQYFPQHRGDANRRIERFGLHFEDAILRELADDDVREREHALTALPGQLKRRLQSEHPAWEIEKVRVFEVTWAQSTRGFFTHYEQGRRKLLTSG